MKLSFRSAVRADWDQIQALHREQQQKQGTNYELPSLSGPMFPAVLVGEDSGGKIHVCFYCEAVPELRVIGSNPRATALIQREAGGLCYLLKNMGFRYLEVFVPQQLKRYISKPLKRAGFEDKESELAYFSRDLRGKE